MNRNKSLIRLMLVDDHNVVRSGLRSLLQGVPHFQIVAEAADGQSALRLCEQFSPDIVLMDLRMPGIGGVQATAMIKQSCPATKIIALTMHDGEEDIYQAIQSGAEAFVLKTANDEELIKTIRTVLEGKYRFPNWLAERLSRRDPVMALTGSEIQIVAMMAEGKSNKEMATTLGVTDHKIKNDLKAVFFKLGCFNRTEAVATAIARGLLKR